MKNYECLTPEELLNELNTNKDIGLTEEEAKKRLEEYGENVLKEKKKKTPLQIFFSQLNDPMIFVLFAAIIITIIVSIYETVKVIKAGETFDFLSTGDWPDAIIIVLVILMNALIGTIQEIKAATSLDALKKMSSPESTVIRDGKRYKIKSSMLVVGDIIVIEEGDTIGADIRLIESSNLKTNESSLTGESLPVEKDASITFSDVVALGDKCNTCFMSTPVTYGRGVGVVVATGMNTEIGKIATSLEASEDEETPLQKSLASLSKVLGLITLGIVGLVLIVEMIWIFVDGHGSSIEYYIEALLSSISLAVAAIPEGLAAVVTIVLSIGTQRMVKANTIVRKLPSVETLGCVSVVCSDKTGTLTQNKMTVLEAYADFKKYTSLDGFDKELGFLAKGMSLCTNATVDEGLYGDPTEIALVVMANNYNMHKSDICKENVRVEELPFDSVRKMMSVRCINDGVSCVYTKGALDSIIKRSTHILVNGVVRDLDEEDVIEIYKANSYYADKALRVLALAIKNEDAITEDEMTFVGLVAMIDPPRKEAKSAVAEFKNAGIKTVMITGDHKDTAFAIAKDLGIATDISECFTGEDVDRMTELELQKVCEYARVFARVSPENKVQIVKAFKANGNICAMTGDGVNDAPSLKTADIGIAMGITGTDVAKGAADMVLTDDNFASIEKAVEEGRSIYSNIRKTVLFLLSSNIAEVFVIFLLILFGLPAPLIAIHLLWVNLVTDSLPAIALGMQPKEDNIMKEKPRNPKDGILSNGGIGITLGFGFILALGVIISYFIPAWMDGVFGIANIKALYDGNESLLLEARTMAFATLALSELFHMIGMSDIKHSFVHVFKDKNIVMLIALVVGTVLQVAVIKLPFMNGIFSTFSLTLKDFMIVLCLSIIPLVLHEVLVLIQKIKK